MSSQAQSRHDNWQHAHHFPSADVQAESSKLGMWLFLLTEILIFGAIFCAFAVYRYVHPEMFHEAHKELNVVVGLINTIVLIFSSFTMALAVRSAQLGQKKYASLLLVVTILCAFVFLGIKSWEYSHKYAHGLFPGQATFAAHPLKLFFVIYFILTGLHGIHIVIGIGVLIWVLIRTLRGEFGPRYFTPVENAGLYWHLVDLIWIYLFPVLYLLG